MTYDQFFKDIKAGRLSPVYLFTGPEQHVKRRALDRLREALLPEGFEQFNEATLDGGSAKEIIEAAETLPLMCDRRLVVVNDWPPLLPGRVRAEEEQVQQMSEWLGRAPDSCCVVFVVRDQPDGRKKMSVELKKWAVPVVFPYLNDPDIAKWANQALKPLNKRIGPEAVARLTFMAGRSLTQLSAEIEKLAAYSGGRDEIVADDVNAMVSPSPEFTVFQMIDSVLEKNPLRARQLLKSLLEGGEDRVGVLALLTRQMRMMTHLRLMRARGDSLGEAARALSLNSYAAELAARHAARFTAESLAEGYHACVEADFAIKSGRLRDEAALDSVMMALDRLV